MSPRPPAPRRGGAAYRLGLVCLGNICRSPMADVVLSELVDRAGLGEQVEVASCGTGGWHAGDPMDRRAAATLLAEDYDPSGHRAQQVDHRWLEWDLLLAMDEQNLADLRDLGGTDPERVRLFRDFDPTGTGPVPDPYYGGPDGFADVLATVERTAIALVAALEEMLPRQR